MGVLTRRHVLGLSSGLPLTCISPRWVWTQTPSRVVVVDDTPTLPPTSSPESSVLSWGFAPSWLSTLWLSLWVAVWVALSLPGVAYGDDQLVRYQIVDGSIPEPLTAQPGDPVRGRRIVLDRDGGDCTICHAMSLPQREFHGTIGPPLDGIGRRATPGALRLRLVDPKALNPETIMPAYYKVAGLHRVLERYRAKTILTAQQIEDILAYLLTLMD